MSWKKQTPWSVELFMSDILCSACVGSSVPGPSEKPRLVYTSFTFCIMPALPPSCRLYLHEVPSRDSCTKCKQAASSACSEWAVPFSWKTQCTLPLTHSTLPSLRHKSLKFILHLIPLWMLLAAIAPGLCTSKWVLMSAQHKHKCVRKRCMG